MPQTETEFIAQLHSEVVLLRTHGVKQLTTAKLEKVLSNALQTAPKAKTEDNHLTVENVRASNALDLELLKAAFVFGSDALKAAILVNGGASVAVMSFASAHWKEASANGVLTTAAASMASFVVGVGLAAVATGASYVTQHEYAHGRNKRAKVLHWTAAFFIVSSYVAFFFGAYNAYSVFVR